MFRPRSSSIWVNLSKKGSEAEAHDHGLHYKEQSLHLVCPKSNMSNLDQAHITITTSRTSNLFHLIDYEIYFYSAY